MSAQADVLVVGGGPAGAACAALLARAGRHVVLVERTTGPHEKVCGGFLSTEALKALRRLGVDTAALGAVPIRRFGLSVRGRRAAVPLPFPAVSLSRQALDEALLRRAADAGAEVHRGAAVRALSMRGGTWRARLSTGAEMEANAAFIATGKHDLRSWPRPSGLQSDLIGLGLHWHPGAGGPILNSGSEELILFPGGYAGLAPVEDGGVNLCLLVRRRPFAALGRRWQAVVESVATASPTLAGLLASVPTGHRQPLAIGAVPFGHLQRRNSPAWHLGDQAAVVPSFTGMGISLALHSSFRATDVFLNGGGPADYHRLLVRDASWLVYPATALSILLVRPKVQAALAGAAPCMPWLMRSCASATRLPVASAAAP